MPDSDLLDRTAAIARDYLGGLDERHVGPRASTALRTISTFSCDIAYAVSPLALRLSRPTRPTRWTQAPDGHHEVGERTRYQASEQERELVERAFRGPIRGPELSETQVTSDGPTPTARAQSDPA